MRRFAFLALMLALLLPLNAQSPKQPPSLRQSLTGHFAALNQRILDMAKDFPAEKYDYRPAPGVRSFGEVIVHILSGNIYATKNIKEGKSSWDEVDPKLYPGKTEIVAALEKSIADAKETLRAESDQSLASSPEPWVGVIEHSAEHFGQLVVYYRNNNMVPPESRPKQ